MEVPTLSQEIIQRRRERAPRLAAILAACDGHTERLEGLLSALSALNEIDTPELTRSREETERLGAALRRLRERTAVRHDRFVGGRITVAIAGLEKAGKTTFLRSLTGIDALPAFDERCTAVRCEIHFDPDRSDFDIEFHTDEGFVEEVLRPLVETVAAALPEGSGISLPAAVTAQSFRNLSLPEPGLLPGGTTAYKLLKDLRRLQENFDACRDHLNKPPLRGRPLSELGEWVSHRRADLAPEEDEGEDVGRHLARIAAVKTCRLHSGFRGGSPHLRWIDTPGVDDPNRRARDMTLATIATETDLLVVASRPGATPSPGESFHRFWDSVSRQPDEIDLLNRMLFALNRDQRVDPDGENIRIHRKYLVDAGVPQHLFAGPFQATDPADAAALMERVNEHLAQHLADQDDRVVDRFGSELKHLEARIRLLHDVLAKARPSDAGLHDQETEAFHRWFHWHREDGESGFWTDLVEALDRSARAMAEDPRIRESEESLNAIFAQEAERIESKIPTPQDLEAFVVRHRGENPVPSGMRTISTLFSTLVNRLSNEIQEFGPIMQDELVKVLEEAGLGPLLAGETSAEKLTHLLDTFSGLGGGTIVEVLRETLELPRNLKYVLRYELRGAVDFCDPTLWDEKESAWSRLADMITANNGDVERLQTFDQRRHPPVTDSREKDSEILKRIAGNAMLGIHAVLNNERYLPRRIADDFIRDCRVRLCFGQTSEQEWRTLLFRNRGALLGQAIAQIRKESQRIGAFHDALKALAAGLP